MNCNTLLKKIESYMPIFDSEIVTKAYEFTKKAHGKQVRASGEPYYKHPLAVAIILAEMHLDLDSIITALLHDTVEDTVISLDDIHLNFGSNVAKLVDGVTKLTKIKFQPDSIREGENFRKLLLAMSEDIRVLIVKLADRLHNMRTVQYLSEKKAIRIAKETVEIYAPLAERIGMQKIKNELQDLAFAVLHPEERKSIINRLEYLRSDGGSLVDKIETHIKKTISDFGIAAEVNGREKTPYSIWQKMRLKNIIFEQLADIIAFRVIVNDVIDCYQVLGILHAAYQMIPGSFKDYISTPKNNGYSSLHTIVVGPNKQRIEIQIRTHEMHHFNDLGVAAHWGYKQNIDLTSNPIDGKRFAWIRELINILNNSETEDFIEHTKLEMYEDQVFCFTPKGEVIALPRKATPIDFAYALHSDIGNSCTGAKINGAVVPLLTILENGDQVEISTSKNKFPSASWEQFVVTARAKSEIRKFIRYKQKKEYTSLGKSILSKFFLNKGREFKEENLQDFINLFHKKNLEDLYSAIGEGSIQREEVFKVMHGKKKSTFDNLKEKFSFFKFNKSIKADNTPILVRGIDGDTVFNFATCCNPLPGDKIVGLFCDDGVTIHTADCSNLYKKEHLPEKLLEVSWDKEAKDYKHHSCLKMVIANEVNSLATVTTIVSKYGCNITNLKFIDRSQDFFELLIDVEVIGLTHLTNLMASLRAKECVHQVERFRE